MSTSTAQGRALPLTLLGVVLLALVISAFSAFYELIEWWTAATSGEAAEAFLGTQGDVWDTQWDMFCALIGATAAQTFSRACTTASSRSANDRTLRHDSPALRRPARHHPRWRAHLDRRALRRPRWAKRQQGCLEGRTPLRPAEYARTAA